MEGELFLVHSLLSLLALSIIYINPIITLYEVNRRNRLNREYIRIMIMQGNSIPCPSIQYLHPAYPPIPPLIIPIPPLNTLSLHPPYCLNNPYLPTLIDNTLLWCSSSIVASIHIDRTNRPPVPRIKRYLAVSSRNEDWGGRMNRTAVISRNEIILSIVSTDLR